MENLICKKCKKSKSLNSDNFYFRKDTQKWRQTCIECLSAKKKNQYLENSEFIKEHAALYREANREKIRKHSIEYNSRNEVRDRLKQYRQDNKKIIREQEKKWRVDNPEKARVINRRKRKKQSQKPSFKLRSHVTRQISFALNRVGGSKQGNSVMKYLPYTIEELKEHLEKQFESWMNWDNYGNYKVKDWDDQNISTWKWNIDHITPQSELPYFSMADENFQKTWSLKNLRPYSAKQNTIDGSTKERHKK